MINIHKCYFHSILSINKYALVKLEEILNDGYIKSAKDLDIDVTGELHQSDEICLSRYTPDVMYENGVNSATKEYLGQFITLILDDNIKTYKPNVVSVFNMNEYIIKSGEYTDLYDEYRTKNPIDINHIIGISLPIQELSENDFAYLAFTDQEVYSYLQYSCSEFLAMDVVRKK